MSSKSVIQFPQKLQTSLAPRKGVRTQSRFRQLPPVPPPAHTPTCNPDVCGVVLCWKTRSTRAHSTPDPWRCRQLKSTCSLSKRSHFLTETKCRPDACLFGTLWTKSVSQPVPSPLPFSLCGPLSLSRSQLTVDLKDGVLGGGAQRRLDDHLRHIRPPDSPADRVTLVELDACGVGVVTGGGRQF